MAAWWLQVVFRIADSQIGLLAAYKLIYLFLLVLPQKPTHNLRLWCSFSERMVAGGGWDFNRGQLGFGTDNWRGQI